MSACAVFTCPRCGAVSHHPRDLAEGYCGACHDWTRPTCPQRHPMRLASRFRFDHEPGDSPAETAALERFRAMGLHLGDDVTVWRCDACDVTEAVFTSRETAR